MTRRSAAWLVGAAPLLGASYSIWRSNLGPKASKTPIIYSSVPLSDNARFGNIVALAFENHGVLYALDGADSRIVVLSQSGHIERQIGSLGNGRGDLWLPTAMCGAAWRLAILDAGNNRVQIFSLDGTRVAGFSYDPRVSPQGIAMSDDGIVYLNTPSSNSLVTAYGGSGGALGSFGTLAHPQECFPELIGQPSFPTPLLNEAHIAASGDGSVWIAFRYVPVVQRYSQAGALLMQHPLSGSGRNDIVNTFLHKPGARPALTHRLKGATRVVPIVSGITITRDKTLVVLLANYVLIEIDGSGGQHRELVHSKHFYGGIVGPVQAVATGSAGILLGTVQSIDKVIIGS